MSNTEHRISNTEVFAYETAPFLQHMSPSLHTLEANPCGYACSTAARIVALEMQFRASVSWKIWLVGLFLKIWLLVRRPHLRALKRVRYNEQQKPNTLRRVKPIQPFKTNSTLPQNRYFHAISPQKNG